MGETGQIVTAALVIIGNEILSGRTPDANLAFLGKTLNEAGIQLKEARVVPDEEPAIIEAVNACRARHAYVFTTGGIGPTHDDITSACIAKAVGRKLTRHPEAERRLRAYYPPEKLNDARLKMAETPEGAELIDNPISVAPGFIVENVHVLPGVPSILQAMVDGLKHKLRGGAVVRSRTVTVFCPEGDIAKPLSEIQARYPTVEIGSYPFMRQDRFGASLVFRSADEAALGQALDALLTTVRERGLETLEIV